MVLNFVNFILDLTVNLNLVSGTYASPILQIHEFLVIKARRFTDCSLDTRILLMYFKFILVMIELMCML